MRNSNNYGGGASALQRSYWTLAGYGRELVQLRRRDSRAFTREVLRDIRRFLLGVTPVPGETRERTLAAVAWLARAQAATPDDGVSYGYFPCAGEPAARWRPSYPETTGYIIVSLLDFADRYADTAAAERARRMAEWEVSVQMANGAVQGGLLCPPERQTPAVFNTGMVLQGYVALLSRQSDPLIRHAARRAADFLVSDLGEDGHFRTHGRFVTDHRVKTYNCLCAWPLYRLGELLDVPGYRKAAIRAVEAAILRQQPNGWFADNCLNRPDAPLLHTIGYALQGILEVGVLAQRQDFLEAVRLAVTPLIRSMSPTGFLHGRYDGSWRPACVSACLTGSAQLAVVCYRLFSLTGEAGLLEAADRIVNFLKALQQLDSGDPGIDGALAGSFPLFGDYMRASYPNWATKYLLDALLLQDRLSR